MYKRQAMKITGKIKAGEGPADMLHEDEYAEDDQSGGELLPELVKVARKSEIEYFRSMGVYDKVPIKECWGVTGWRLYTSDADDDLLCVHRGARRSTIKNSISH